MAPEKAKVFQDSDFWYHKGITTGKKDRMETAIECYKQALKIVYFSKVNIL